MLPKEKTVKEMVTFIDSVRSEKTVEAALERLQNIIENQEFDVAVEENQTCLANLMKNFPNSKKIQEGVLKLIGQSLASIIASNKKSRHESNDCDEVNLPCVNLSRKFMEKFFYLFLENDNSKDSLLKFLRIVLLMSHFESVVDDLAEFKIIKYLLEMIKKNADDAALCSLLCKTIWSLSSNGN